MINPKSLANLKPAKPGEIRNPKGRPVGSRHILESAFFEDAYRLWEKKGAEALELMAAEKPNEFCRMIAMLMPAKAEINNDKTEAQRALENATYEQLVAVISAATALVVSPDGTADQITDGAGTQSTEIH